ncbi:MAG TPA: hypothetical protein VFQ85_02235 [Mycobacteriales bacterium]|jgi:hypothetical protein|nr:hypothetical protein [Mycobacteriales bacterium]
MRKFLAGAVVATAVALPVAPAHACMIDPMQPPPIECTREAVVGMLKDPPDPTHLDCMPVAVDFPASGMPPLSYELCPPTR